MTKLIEKAVVPAFSHHILELPKDTRALSAIGPEMLADECLPEL